jgi:hypothetical protein
MCKDKREKNLKRDSVRTCQIKSPGPSQDRRKVYYVTYVIVIDGVESLIESFSVSLSTHSPTLTTY